MNMPTTDIITIQPQPYQPPALIVLGSVAAITLSANQGSVDDFKGRDRKFR